MNWRCWMGWHDWTGWVAHDLSSPQWTVYVTCCKRCKVLRYKEKPTWPHE